MYKKSFTLVEMITVLAIIGVGSGLFYFVFFMNFASFDSQIASIDLWQNTNEITEKISLDVRFAEDINFIDNKNVILSFPSGEPVTYTITPEGNFQRIRGEIVSTLSQNIDFANSFFNETSQSLIVTLTLQDYVFGKKVEVKTATEVCLRNLRGV